MAFMMDTSHGLATASVLICLTSGAIYLYLLSNYLRSRHPKARPRSPPTLEEYEAANSYKDIDLLGNAPREPTGKGYAIIGGAGFVGTHLVRLLLMRGETNLRIIGIESPPKEILLHPAVTYVEADIASLTAIRAALSKPFESTGKAPSFVYHLAATIRFWERFSYTWNASYRINVEGTANILQVLEESPLAGHVESLVYVSSAHVVVPRLNLWSLVWKTSKYPWNIIRRSDSDRPLTENERTASCYGRSKKMAEDLVLLSNGKHGLKTGILRPGHSILGLNDRVICSTLNLPTVPMFDQHLSHKNITAWDLASGLLLYENALQHCSDEVAGQVFLITGADSEAWTLGDIRRAVKHYSKKPITFQDVSPVLILVIAHLIELILLVRFYLLNSISTLFGSTKPSLAPKWLGQALILQPATLDYFIEAEVDDSRVRKLLGYKPQWGVLQTIKYVVDEYEKLGATAGKHGLETDSYLN